MQVPRSAMAKLCRNDLQKCRHERRPPDAGRAPTTCWCCWPSAGPALRHRGRGAGHQPHDDLAPHRRTRAVDRWPRAGQGAGGWELTDLGREALSAAEAVESAVRSLTADEAGARTLEGVVRISATDGFSAYIAAPAAAQVQRRHPKVAVEIVAATRRATQQRSGLDIEVVVGEPQVHRAEAIRLGDYCLGLYGSRDYLAEHGTPLGIDDLARYPLVYFIDSMLQVDDLDLATNFAPAMRESVSSTNVFVHVEATRAAAGLGLLPCFMADRHDDLVRVLRDAVAIRLTYWFVARAETLRRPERRCRGRGDPRPHARAAPGAAGAR